MWHRKRASHVKTITKGKETKPNTDDAHTVTEHARRVGDAVRKHLELSGVMYKYGSARLPYEFSAKTVHPNSTSLKLILDRMDDVEYVYPTDMYGGFH